MTTLSWYFYVFGLSQHLHMLSMLGRPLTMRVQSEAK